MAGEDIYLRQAMPEDKDLLYQWRNDPVCRENSLDQSIVPYESHCAWFQDRLGSGDCFIFICMEKDSPIGQVRVDYQGRDGKISYSISEGYRGRGYGARMLGLLEQDAGIRMRTAGLYAIVKCSNVASQKCFESAVAVISGTGSPFLKGPEERRRRAGNIISNAESGDGYVYSIWKAVN